MICPISERDGASCYGSCSAHVFRPHIRSRPSSERADCRPSPLGTGLFYLFEPTSLSSALSQPNTWVSSRCGNLRVITLINASETTPVKFTSPRLANEHGTKASRGQQSQLMQTAAVNRGYRGSSTGHTLNYPLREKQRGRSAHKNGSRIPVPTTHAPIGVSRSKTPPLLKN